MADMQSKQLEMDAKFHVSLLELQKEILKVSTNILNILQVTNDMPPLQANVQEKGPAEEPMKWTVSFQSFLFNESIHQSFFSVEDIFDPFN